MADDLDSSRQYPPARADQYDPGDPMVTPIMLLNTHSTDPHAGDDHEAPPVQATQQDSGVVDTIDQVRELLYGDAMRHHGRRVEDLGGAMRDLEQRIMRRIDEMQNAVDALARTMRVEQSNAVRSIGLTLAEMGRQIASAGAVTGSATEDARGERAGSDANP